MELSAKDILQAAYAAAGRKLDMGGSCLRFKRFEDLLTEPITRLVASTSVEGHIARYEAGRSKLAQ